MARWWQCRNGHSWLDRDGNDATCVTIVAVCSICGGEAEEVVAPSAKEETLVRSMRPRNAELERPSPPTTPAPPAVLLETVLPPPARTVAGLSGPAPPALDETFVRPDHTAPPAAPSHLPSSDETLQRPASVARPAGTPRAPQVAGYEILGTLGRGGMGVVYKARQNGLDRLVALKMILAGAHAGPDDLARFRTEAQAVAQLQHPNIVQIYEVGERDGLPFFSLEYLEGGTLQQKLQGAPLSPRAAAQMLEPLARAVAFAHERGIVHRDLKPANILLTADGTPKITDFGLAKRLQQDGPAQTGTEAILGTPNYMAPEQAEGKARDVGPAGDVYALGAVLYDLLTGRPPFQGTTILETLNQVRNAEPVPPARLAPGVPRDLQTICLKCLAKDPRRRYVAADDLADDLRRYLDNRPIIARPTSAWERGWKWARRNPALASLLLVGVLAVAGGTGLVAAHNVQLQEKSRQLQKQKGQIEVAAGELRQANHMLTESKKDLQQANAALQSTNVALEASRREAQEAEALARREEQEAQASFLQAQAAIEKIIHLAQDRLRNQPHAEKVRRELLENALAMCTHFLGTRGGSPAVQLRSARARRMAGDVAEHLGRYPEARQHYRAAAALYRKLIDGVSAHQRAKADAYRKELAEVLLNLGAVLEHDGGREAEQVLLQVDRLLDQPPLDPAQKEVYRLYRGARFNNLAIHYQKLGDVAAAAAAYREAGELLGRLPKRPRYQLELARIEANEGALWTARQGERSAEAAEAYRRGRAAYEQAVRRLEPLVTESRPDPAFAKELGRVYANLAVLLKNNGQPYDALCSKAVGLFEGLLRTADDLPDYRHLLAVQYGNWGQFLLQDGRHAQAQECLRKARRLLENLANEFPEVSGYRKALARCCNGLGMALLSEGSFTAARESLDKALELLDGLVRANPAQSEYCHDWQAVCENLLAFHDDQARRCARVGLWPKAEEHVRQLVELRDREAARLPSPTLADQRARTRLALARLLLARRSYQEAATAVEQVFAVAPRGWTKTPDAIRLLARCTRAALDDGRLSPARRRELVRRHGLQALDQLREVVRQGGKGVGALLASPEWSVWKGSARFRKDFDALRDEFIRQSTKSSRVQLP